MAFRFRLEKVLQYRRRLLEEQTREVAAANRAVEAIDQRLADLAEQVQQQLTTETAGPNPSLSVAHLMNRRQWLDHLERRRETVRQERATAQDALAEARKKLNAAWRDLEVLEQLKKKQRQAWAQRQEKREQQALDEQGQIRAHRNDGEKVS
ncbi:flagellar export protein FliJ [bacterium DOLJORAL78_65_58]|nr:MAG: flagellar export protein FliJ [bacterium DOLZORAL124_64_63]PIE76245.1 MAG: flagellar export protein FliJ [bacterium DOLJORAL78_65_58]